MNKKLKTAQRSNIFFCHDCINGPRHWMWKHTKSHIWIYLFFIFFTSYSSSAVTNKSQPHCVSILIWLGQFTCPDATEKWTTTEMVGNGECKKHQPESNNQAVKSIKKKTNGAQAWKPTYFLVSVPFSIADYSDYILAFVLHSTMEILDPFTSSVH